jgi:hypothetical protein
MTVVKYIYLSANCRQALGFLLIERVRCSGDGIHGEDYNES